MTPCFFVGSQQIVQFEGLVVCQPQLEAQPMQLLLVT